MKNPNGCDIQFSFFPIYEHVVLVFHSVAKDFMHQFLHMCLKIKTWYQFKSVWFPMLNETFSEIFKHRGYDWKCIGAQWFLYVAVLYKRAYLCRGGCFPISLESSSRNAGKSWKAVMKNDWADYSSLLLCTFHLSKLHLLIPLLRRYLGTETSVNNKVWGETWGISLQCTQPAINSLSRSCIFAPKYGGS